MLSEEELAQCAQASQDLKDRAAECTLVQTQLLDKVLNEYRSVCRQLREARAVSSETPERLTATSNRKNEEGRALASSRALQWPSSRVADTEPFTVVLIDGNDFQFSANLVKLEDCRQPGVAAAQQIERSINKIRGPKTRLIVRVFADVPTVETRLGDAFPSLRREKMQDFAASFNKHGSSFEFCDTWHVKDKVEETLNILGSHPQCARIFLASRDRTAIRKFRDHKQEIASSVWQMIARGTSEDNPDHLTSYPIIDMGNTLTTTKSARSMQGFTPRGLHLPADATEHSGSSDLIAINSIGHRIDPYLKDYTEKDKREYASNYAGQGICSYYGLLGECHRRSCTFRHYDVSPSAKRFMRVVMRRRGCTIGGRCRLPDCIYGHTCPVPKCKGLADCERPVWMHDQSRDIVKRVLPDTTATMLGDGTLRKLTAARKVSSDSASLPDMERRQKRLSDLAPPSQASGDDTLDETAAVQQWRARLEQRSQQASEPGTERATLENEEGGYHKAQPAPASQNAVTYTPSAPQTDASDDSIEPHTPSTTTRDRVLVKVTENGVPSQAQDAGVLEAFESEGVKGSDFGHVEDLIVFEGDF